jgi:hypothetical protein
MIQTKGLREWCGVQGKPYSCVHCDRTRRRVIDDFPDELSVMQGPVD